MALTKANNRMIDGSLINVWDFLTDAQINDVKTNALIDVTSGVQAAIDHAISERHQSLFFPAGRYRLTDTITINEGLKLVGNGSQGSTEQFGTTLIIDHTNTAVHFSGTGRDYAGTGGGMKHFLVLKRAGQIGGQGILIDGSDVNKRNGEMQFEDLLVSASSTGRFTYVFHVDGTAFTTSGSKGIRSINFNKVRLTGGDGTVPYVLLNQVTHFTSTHLQVEQAAGSAPVVFEVKGDSANVLCSNANINGEVKIGASASGAAINGFVFMGRCASFNNTNNNVDGLVCAQIPGTITNSSQALNIISSNTSTIEKLDVNTSSNQEDSIRILVGLSEVGKIGTTTSQILKMQPTNADGEVHLGCLNSSSLSRAYLAQYSQFRASTDGSQNLGAGSFRWGTVFASTGTINTSDKTEKRDIRDLNAQEVNVAIALKSKIKAFRFNDAYEEKGDDARVHFGVIAQDVQACFEAEGLDPERYGIFCKDTWFEVDGEKINPETNIPYQSSDQGVVEVTRYGVRYDELLAFIISTL